MKKGIWIVVKLVYAQILRDLVVQAINDPDKEWDDILLRALDALFEYKV